MTHAHLLEIRAALTDVQGWLADVSQAATGLAFILTGMVAAQHLARMVLA